jgi:hypothetical protein
MKRRTIFSAAIATILAWDDTDATKRAKRRKRRKKRKQKKCTDGIATYTACIDLGQSQCRAVASDPSRLNICYTLAHNCCFYSKPASGYATSCGAKQAWAARFHACFNQYVS